MFLALHISSLIMVFQQCFSFLDHMVLYACLYIYIHAHVVIINKLNRVIQFILQSIRHPIVVNMHDFFVPL